MGNWNISIEGHGFHHNTNTPDDANRMAKKFVDDLKAAGHHIAKATITVGSADDLQTMDYSGYDTKA